MAGQRRSRQEWARLVEEWRRSRQGAREFCRQRGLKPTTFSWWRWKLGQQSDADCGGWLEVARIESPPAAKAAGGGTELVLILGEGIAIKVPVGFDAATLERLIQTLGVIEC